MNRIVVDQSAANQLAGANLSSEFEVLDPSGRMLGVFVPGSAIAQQRSNAYQWLKSQIDDAEIDRRTQDSSGRSTAEVQARLKSL
jgi:hypothetical protein